MTVTSNTERRWKRTIWKYDFELEQASFPEGLLFARNTTLPAFEIHGTVFAFGFGEEAERMVAPPLLAGGFWSDVQCVTSVDILRTAPLAICSGTATLCESFCRSRKEYDVVEREEAYGAERKRLGLTSQVTLLSAVFVKKCSLDGKVIAGRKVRVAV